MSAYNFYQTSDGENLCLATLQAFSHFTYEYNKHKVVHLDFQCTFSQHIQLTLADCMGQAFKLSRVISRFMIVAHICMLFTFARPSNANWPLVRSRLGSLTSVVEVMP